MVNSSKAIAGQPDPSPSRADEHGFTMVEVLVAATILVVGVLSLLTLLDTANAGTATVRARDGATNLARQVIEAARSIPYSSLNQTVETQLQNQPGLDSQGGGAGWTLQRGGVSYSVAATVCAVDDPADGMGAHDAGVFCADTGAAGSADANPDDYKRVTADVSWTVHSLVRHVYQVAVINNPGSAGGPAVTSLTPHPPLTALITSSLTGVSFDATTSMPAAAVSISVDGVPTAPAGGSSLLWSFLWPISGLVDGTHLVTAQAFDTQGLSGATRSVTMTLNRFIPAAPTGLVGGRNGSVVDLEWLPNPEGDIAGYRAFRQPLIGAPQLACPLTVKSACQDTSPPAGLALTYFVVADDHDLAGVLRDGLPSLPITVLSTNHAPYAPTGLTATSSNGTTTLSWTPASPADPDGGPVAFYRIYRDGVTFADRYDRTGLGTDLTYVDARPDGVTHQYWITAVDSQLAESPRVGPVTR